MFKRSTIAAIAAFLAAQSSDLAMQGDKSVTDTDRRIERGVSPARDAHALPHHNYDRYHNLHRG